VVACVWRHGLIRSAIVDRCRGGGDERPEMVKYSVNEEVRQKPEVIRRQENGHC
jgi:hypothetical protein